MDGLGWRVILTVGIGLTVPVIFPFGEPHPGWAGKLGAMKTAPGKPEPSG